MNGNNRLVTHCTIVKMVFPAPDVSANRGIVYELEAKSPDPLAVVNPSPEPVFGANSKFTVAGPGAGELLLGLALYRYHTAKSKLSSVAGLVVNTSQVALALPFTGMISA
jgi:hypothetical protein